MPLPIPNLDDRTFADLVAEGRAMIPRLAPEWTNHNPADAGMTLLELLAFVTETVLYEVDRVPEAAYRKFLALVGSPAAPGEDVEAAIVRAVGALGTRTRAASRDDFEALAVELGGAGVARARALPDLNLEGTSASGEAHLSLVVLPAAGVIGLATPAARTAAALRAAMTTPAAAAVLAVIRAPLQARLLVTTVLHVVPPGFVEVAARVRLVAVASAIPARVAADAEARLRAYLDPYEGGDAKDGWPFGRAVHKAELLQQLEGVPGVDHVEELVVNDDPTDNPVPLAGHELACAGAIAVTVAAEGPP